MRTQRSLSTSQRLARLVGSSRDPIPGMHAGLDFAELRLEITDGGDRDPAVESILCRIEDADSPLDDPRAG